MSSVSAVIRARPTPWPRYSGATVTPATPAIGTGPAVPPLAHVVVQRGADQPAAVEGAQAAARGHGRLDDRLDHRLVDGPERADGQVDVLVPVEVLGERADDHVSGQPSFSMTSSGTE